MKNTVISLATLAVLSTACSKMENLDPIKAITKPFKSEKKSKSSSIKNASNTNEQITVGEHNIHVISQTVAKQLKAQGQLVSANKMVDSISSDEESLLVGIPKSLIGQQNVFGAVITKVSDKTSEDLGGLKLTDLPTLHVRTEIQYVGKVPVLLNLYGCGNDCTERSRTKDALISLPIDYTKSDESIIYLDMNTLGQGLDLMTIMDPDGDYTGLRTIKSATTEVNYDLSNLLFDVKSTMIAKDTAEDQEAAAPVTEITVRWYLKLASSFDPAFESRSPTPGVGFFETQRAKATKITRWSMNEDTPKIKYYIKNVPAEYRAHFSGALDNWNEKFKELLGFENDRLEYEFIEKSDPRHAQLVSGDIRYNIIEWDEDNKASYGGLGPSIANQFTGQTFAAHVLIQGPTIIDMYTKWFELSKDIRALKAQGQIAQASKIERDFNTKAKAEIAARSSKAYSLKFGKNLEFRINSQRPELEDPMIKNHFEVVPAGVTFQEYMKGYFTEMLEHELGHNFGLRHNFKGNLGASDSGQRGSASRSIMEYLGRPYRMLNQIGLYDEMAIKYGYTGEAPKHLNWFCTDENQATSAKNIALLSPECTKSDATSDPFSFWEARVKRALDLVLDLSSPSAPVWKTAEVNGQIVEFTLALDNYAAAADKTADSWTNFFGKADRPENKADVKPYVLTKIKALICDPKLADVIKGKESQEASDLAQKNLDDLRKAVADTSTALGVFTATDLKCN